MGGDMTHDQYSVIIVYSTSHAMRIETLLQKKGIICKMIPVPRQISSDCGVCVRVLRSDVKEARQVIKEAQVEIEGVYDI
jgi:bacterioferritin-associated ferredoxin